MQTIVSDVRHAVRMFWNAPGFSLAVTLTLALGIGVNVAVFSQLHAALLASLPVREPDRLVQVTTWTSDGGDHSDFSYPLYVDIRDAADVDVDVFSALAAYLTGTVGIAAGDRTDRVLVEFVTSNYFPVLGIQLPMGPGLMGADELRGGPRVAVVSDALWRRMFDADAAIVGRTVALNGQVFTVVGVAPPGFEGIVRGQRAELWVSVSQFFPLRGRPDLLDARTSSWMNLMGTLALLAVALAAVGIYGLVSFSVAERTREVGLRLALGARPGEVVRLVLGTGARLAAAGVALGLVLTLWLTRTVAAELYGITPTDPVTLVGACAFLSAVVLAATLIPALRVMRVDPMTALREGF